MIGTLDVVVLDCSGPRVLARFTAALLGGEIVGFDEGWAEVALPFTDHRPILAFQRVEAHRAPEWPGQDVPQQAHLDVEVDDLDAGETAVLGIGATATGSTTDTFRVLPRPGGAPVLPDQADGLSPSVARPSTTVTFGSAAARTLPGRKTFAPRRPAPMTTSGASSTRASR